MRPVSIFKIQDNPDSPDLLIQIENYLTQELLDRLEIIKITPQKILVLGQSAGTEDLLKKLQNRYSKSAIILLSLSDSDFVSAPALETDPKGQRGGRKIDWPSKLSKIFKLPHSPVNKISGSFDSLPFIKNSFDLIISNLHIFNSDLKKSLPELSRILKKDGLLMLTLPGPDTFLELRQAMAYIDSHTHVPIFPDMHDLGDQLIKAKFKDPVVDSERFILNLKNLEILLKNLKKIKKYKNIKLKQDPNFPRFLYAKNKFDIFKKNYLINSQGAYPVQFEITFAHAWGTDPQQTIDLEGYARVSLEGLKDSLKKESLRSPPDK